MCVKYGNHLQGRESHLKNGLTFDDKCISECKGTWRTCDAVTEEAWENVQYSYKYTCFLPCEPPIVVHSSHSMCQRPKFIAFLYSVRSCTHTYIQKLA